MLEQISPLWDVYLNKRNQQQPLVLATLVKTTGSSYKKRGAMVLVEADKTVHGLISGGCLEADVAEHAGDVFESGQPKVIQYDLSDDSIFGLGAGCDGSITLVLQLLINDYLPFSALNPTKDHAQTTKVYINHEETTALPLAAFAIVQPDSNQESHQGLIETIKSDEWLIFQPPPKVIIMGAGFDALPLCQLMTFLHWHVYLIDHRPGKLKNTSHATQATLIQFDSTCDAQHINNINANAAIIMSHNIDQDGIYLQLIAASNIPFVGLLGPKARRDKVLQIAGLSLSAIASRLHAPVGLELGGRMPENIAVSVVAQLQAEFNLKSKPLI